MRILIDLQCCQSGSRLGGIGRYSMSLVKAMLRLGTGHQFALLLNARLPHENAIRAEFAELLPQRDIHSFSIPPFVAGENDLPANTRIAELIREKYIADIAPDVLHIASLFEGAGEDVVTSVGLLFPASRTVVTLYDLIPYLDRAAYFRTVALEDYYLRKFDLLKTAGMLLSISDYSRQEAIQHAGVAPERIVNISSAADGQFAPREIDESAKVKLLRKFGITKPFVLFTSRLESRKNHERLIMAYGKVLPSLATPCQLVIVGKGDPDQVELLKSIASDHGLEGHDLVFVGHVNDDELVCLYNLCTLFVFPSLREGFGLPVLEAMSCGAATIGSNSTSVPEVIDWDGALFDPESIDDIAAKMLEFLSDDAAREKLRKHGLRQARQFSWERSARRALDAIEKLSETSRSTRVNAATDARGRISANYTRFLAELSAQPPGKADDGFLKDAARSIAVNELRKCATETGFKLGAKVGWIPINLAPDELKEWQSALSEAMLDAVFIQTDDLRWPQILSEFVNEQKRHGRMIFVALASTKSLGQLTRTESDNTRRALKACDRIFVPTAEDVADLEELKIWKNVSLVPKGLRAGLAGAGGPPIRLDASYLFGQIGIAIAESQDHSQNTRVVSKSAL